MKQSGSRHLLQSKFWQKWSIAFRILPVVILAVFLKSLAHIYDLEMMELNSLFTSLVAGTIFLIGFLITGVLTDYKESEKIPSELAATIKSLIDDAYTIYKCKNSNTAKQLIDFHIALTHNLIDWLYKKERTQSLLLKISQMNDYFARLDTEGVQANYIIKMKNDQSTIRRLIMRIDTIRDTGFIGSAYAIVEAMWLAIAIGLFVIFIEPFYASLFFTTLVIFLISYMLLLIKDLDNPFDYSRHGESGTEVSLRPLHDLKIELTNL
jgi:hypothetical protein